MKGRWVLLLLLLGLACQGQPEPMVQAPATSTPQAGSAVEALLRKVDRPREKLDRNQLQGAWSLFKSSGRRAQALGGDHPVLVVFDAPDVALGDLVFLGSIEVSMGQGREGFDWETARTHLKGRAQEHGADLVLVAKIQKDPVGKGYRRVLAAAYRYVDKARRQH